MPRAHSGQDIPVAHRVTSNPLSTCYVDQVSFASAAGDRKVPARTAPMQTGQCVIEAKRSIRENESPVL